MAGAPAHDQTGTRLMFVSIHIPKTAGTALARIFEETTLHRVIYDYGTERDLTASRQCPDIIRDNRDFIKEYFHYFHGHFHYIKYADVFNDCPFITTVRNPVDRVKSQYRHIAMSGDPGNERHRLIMAGQMDIVKFSKFPYIGNAQWYYLEGRPVEEYDFIFIQEDMTRALTKFAARFQRHEILSYLSWADAVPEVNRREGQTWSSKAIPFTAADLKEVEKNCERDMEIYRKAVELFGP